MGIPKFVGEYISRLPYYVKPKEIKSLKQCLRGRPVTTLLIDVNGLLHPVAQKVFAYSDDPKKVTREMRQHVIDTPYEILLLEYREKLHATLDGLLKSVHVTKRIILAVDGVAPAAKINQQRGRRYGGLGRTEVNGYKFDSNCLTPGTDFMYTVDGFLQEWTDKMASYGYDMHYSSHLEHGEGEHKIFWTAKEHVGPREVVAVHGLDGDLFMLGLTAMFSVVLLREDRQRGETFFLIDNLKKYILNLFSADRRRLSYQRCYEDFIIVLYLIGNDFLPRLAMVDNVADMVDALASTHQRLGQRTISRGPGELNYDTLRDYFMYLGPREIDLLMHKTMIDYYYPHPAIQSDQARELIRTRRPASVYLSTVREKMFANADPDRISRDYLDGIAWVFKYYTTQSNWSKLWIYKSPMPPLISGMCEALCNGYRPSNNTLTSEHPGFSVRQQLLAVMPPGSVDLMDPYPGLGDHILEGGDLEDMSPVASVMVYENIKRKDDTYLGKRLLPVLDIQRVLDTVE